MTPPPSSRPRTGPPPPSPKATTPCATATRPKPSATMPSAWSMNPATKTAPSPSLLYQLLWDARLLLDCDDDEQARACAIG
ncbi:hypothetical protein Thiowin_00084 [Thiorhodovibrio winogradskyi]|uniref:Uncharacterized protein n=1 Tax=Thiorhodovibrio winogradskyi TaxID=77007 RepID=A0ABZ0S1I6_9GAMM|nr:hypothetical protein [Thiorhodovibrio winogradskyi]